ncbi:hypothetical protein CONLIGDRAFT_449859 [Coniochaeta ligniaria NRRL 30616]|uniref:Uncharacterized protein n=1 Tax=Coniochaeta ligniaria NRRL 30616 TaxID=1408157 RepID=A0A1J7J397_9PEZI|nr:hypothetical protein CONLIGDRAFT_449859 [Coniochaeta ligniaria NRRL 30616]
MPIHGCPSQQLAESGPLLVAGYLMLLVHKHLQPRIGFLDWPACDFLVVVWPTPPIIVMLPSYLLAFSQRTWTSVKSTLPEYSQSLTPTCDFNVTAPLCHLNGSIPLPRTIDANRPDAHTS